MPSAPRRFNTPPLSGRYRTALRRTLLILFIVLNVALVVRINDIVVEIIAILGIQDGAKLGEFRPGGICVLVRRWTTRACSRDVCDDGCGPDEPEQQELPHDTSRICDVLGRPMNRPFS